MVHVLVVRRLARAAAKRALREATEVRFRSDRSNEVSASVGPFSASFDVPETVDSPGDLPF